ncbi:Uncharacterised protein [uncultured archaeon]|nr:Uncharacterised protein [uncultured archaeon]
MVKKMNAKLVFIALSVLLLLAACAKQAVPAAKPEAPPAPAPAPVVQPPAAEDTAATDIDNTNAEVDAISNDLNTTAIDDIDKDIAEIDNLDLE